MVLDLSLNLLGEGGESVEQLTHGGVLTDADALELVERGVQVLQVQSGELSKVLGDGGLRGGIIYGR